MGTCGGGQPRNYIANKKEQGGEKNSQQHTHRPGEIKRSSARRATTTTEEDKKLWAELILPNWKNNKK
jgi:hypothetical protein